MDEFKISSVTPEDYEAMDGYDFALDDAVDEGDVNKINAVFDELKALSNEDRERVTRALEKLYVEDTRDLAKEAKDYLKSKPGASLSSFGVEEGVIDDPKGIQAAFHLFVQLAQIRGAAADPFTRAFAQEAKKLRVDERQSMEKLLQTIVKAYDTAFPPRPQNKAPKGPGGF